MDEYKWLTKDDPKEMLSLLIDNPDHDNINCYQGTRKLRMFACACRSCYVPKLTDYYDIAETIIPSNFISSTEKEWAFGWTKKNTVPSDSNKACFIREIFGNPYHVYLTICNVCHGTGKGVPISVSEPPHFKQECANCKKCNGRKLISGIKREWLTTNVIDIANSIYQERSFENMPILGDALEDACCNDITILNHCRNLEICPKCLGKKGKKVYIAVGPDFYWSVCNKCNGTGWIALRGPHVRGCWVLDLLLGKE